MATHVIERTDATGIIPEQQAAEIIQGAISNSVALSMGRRLANMTSKTYSMPVLEMLPMAYFVNGDTGMKQTTKMKWGNKKIVAEEIAVIVPIPEAVLADASYDIWSEVKPRIMEAAGAVIDGAIFFGTNKPASWRDGILTTATAAGAVVTATDDVYTDIMGENGVIAKVEQSGYIPTGHLADISMRAKLRGILGNDGHPIFKTDMQGSTAYALDGAPMEFPLNGAWEPDKALMITGAFNELVYSIRQDITYKLLDQAVIQDPSTQTIVYNLAQQDMVALRAVIRLGWELPNPVNALQPDPLKRSPFAIYAPAAG